MSLSPRLETYLSTSHSNYDLIPHGYCETAYDAACNAHLPASQVAKSIILKDRHNRQYYAAVLPASHKIKLDWINHELGRDLQMATEAELARLFPDCEEGAVPALLQAYDFAFIWDDQLAKQPELYLEAGSHRELLHMSQGQFKRLYNAYPHSSISLPREQYAFYHADEMRGTFN